MGILWNLFYLVWEKMFDNVVEILDLFEFKSVFFLELYFVVVLFLKNGYDVRIVGGVVCDIFLGL